MKIIVIILMAFSFAAQSWGQAKFYNAKGEKTTIIGEKTVLFFPEISECFIPQPPDKKPTSLGAGLLMATLLPSAVDLGFKGIGKLIEKNTKKFASEFSARTPYVKSGSAFISQFDVYRTILVKSEKQKDTVFTARIVPLEIEGGKYFCFCRKGIGCKKKRR